MRKCSQNESVVFGRFARIAAAVLLSMPAVLSAQGATSGVIGGNAAAPDNGVAVEVTVRPASELFTWPRRQASASVLARNQSRISAQLSAIVTFVLADAGSSVKQGDVLARLDDSDVRLSMTQAIAQRDGLRARLQLARRQLKRLRDLKSNNFVSTEAVNQRDAEVVALRAELKGANTQVAIVARRLEKCVIRAPFDSVIATRTAQVGELTSPGAPLFTLVQLGNEEISANIALGDAGQLGAAKGFELQVGNQVVPVKMLRLSPVVSPQTRTREARFAFTGKAVPSGSQGRLLWPDPRGHLPPGSLVRRNGQLGVFTVTDAKAIFLPLPSAQEGRPAAVTFDPATSIVVKGQAGLQKGRPVRTVGAK